MYMKCTDFGFKKENLHKGLRMLHLTGMIMACIKNIYSYTVKRPTDEMHKTSF